MTSGYTYRGAGVDIEAGDALVEAIKPAAKATLRSGVMGGLGGFGALFDLKAAGYSDPLLVSSTDGVGTKLKIAIAAGIHDTVGQDLVAMCVNDLVVQGAEPLFFLDYFASSRLQVTAAAAVIQGIAKGCEMAGCALIGGETAEMPGLYADGDYDLAGFVVGAVERDRLLTGADVAPGDLLIGIASSGIHSNGYSLVRRIVEGENQAYDGPSPVEEGVSLARTLLTPTKIYVKGPLAAHRQGLVKAFAHITGSGIIGNLPRVLPDGMAAEVDAGCWKWPPIFDWLQKTGRLSAHEMANTFNCGLGMIAVVSRDKAPDAMTVLAEAGESVGVIGRIVEQKGDARTTVIGPAGSWGQEKMWVVS